MVGALALASIGSLRFDTTVLTCCGLADGRVTTHNLRDAEVKQAMIPSAARMILAADSTKFRQTAMAVVASATAAEMIVTDTDAPAEIVESLRGRRGWRCAVSSPRRSGAFGEGRTRQ